MASLFTKMLQGEVPFYKVAEDDRFFALLDIRPVKRGHTLVIPKQEVDYIFDMEDALLGDLMIFAKKVARVLKAVISCKKVGVMVAGLEVPHTHIHLIPMDAIPDLSFSNARAADPQDLENLAAELRGKF